MDPIKNRAVNAEDEIFWREIREAVRLVSADTTKDLVIERANKHAHINVRRDNKANLDFVAIHMWDIDPTPPTLIAPIGSDD